MARRRDKRKRKRRRAPAAPVSVGGAQPLRSSLLDRLEVSAPPQHEVVRRNAFGWVVRLARKTRKVAAPIANLGPVQSVRQSLASIAEFPPVRSVRNSLASIAELPPVRRITLYLDPPDPTVRLRRRLRVTLYSLLTLAFLMFASRSLSRDDLSRWIARFRAVVLQQRTGAPAEIASAPAPGPRADDRLRRERPSVIRGGVLHVPSTFSSADGAYDLVVHFHGDVKIVLEGLETAKVNAVLGIVNLGVGSGSYESAYTLPGSYEALLAQCQQIIADRGLRGARLRRVALSSWSAGYGAISTILQTRQKKEPLDALLMADGLHCGRLPERPKELNFRQMAPFVEAAREAAEGRILFSITHSEIDPIQYVPTGEAASYLIDAVREHGVENLELVAPERLKLKAAAFAVEPKLAKYLEPTRDTRVGSLHVRGFTGQTTEHHVAHLTQMGATVYAELARRWAPKP